MSDKIIVPDFYKDKLKDNSALNGIVNSTIADFEIWLQQNKMKFFDGYTDHGISHINNILDLSANIIREQCCELIYEKDSAIFIIACLLHDCAMHLSMDGFIDLVQGTYKNNYINGFNDIPWDELWDDFIIEARKFSSRKLISIFGDPEPISIPDFNKKNFTDKDYLLIGEFVRRHHHRLAHEIAIFGVPGPSNKKLKVSAQGDYDFIPDLAGLLARSHGMEMRMCFNYIQQKYFSLKDQRKAHVIFLMTLLRIADILQIQKERAPLILDNIRTIGSPISKLEWETHRSIKDIKYDEFPETIFVEAQPDNSKIFIKVKKLLNRIQSEIDNSWIIIGEVL